MEKMKWSIIYFIITEVFLYDLQAWTKKNSIELGGPPKLLVILVYDSGWCCITWSLVKPIGVAEQPRKYWRNQSQTSCAFCAQDLATIFAFRTDVINQILPCCSGIVSDGASSAMVFQVSNLKSAIVNRFFFLKYTCDQKVG